MNEQPETNQPLRPVAALVVGVSLQRVPEGWAPSLGGEYALVATGLRLCIVDAVDFYRGDLIKKPSVGGLPARQP